MDNQQDEKIKRLKDLGTNYLLMVPGLNRHQTDPELFESLRYYDSSKKDNISLASLKSHFSNLRWGRNKGRILTELHEKVLKLVPSAQYPSLEEIRKEHEELYASTYLKLVAAISKELTKEIQRQFSLEVLDSKFSFENYVKLTQDEHLIYPLVAFLFHLSILCEIEKENKSLHEENLALLNEIKNFVTSKSDSIGNYLKNGHVNDSYYLLSKEEATSLARAFHADKRIKTPYYEIVGDDEGYFFHWSCSALKPDIHIKVMQTFDSYRAFHFI